MARQLPFSSPARRPAARLALVAALGDALAAATRAKARALISEAAGSQLRRLGTRALPESSVADADEIRELLAEAVASFSRAIEERERGGPDVVQRSNGTRRGSGEAELQWVGCFLGGPKDDLKMQIGWGYNSESCKVACAGSPYMALQGGGWCFCGTPRTQGGLSKRLRDEDCWPACAGESAMEPARPCGGYLSNAVYALDDVQHRAARTHRDGEMAVAYLAMPIVPVAFVLMALCVAPSRRAGSGASAT